MTSIDNPYFDEVAGGVTVGGDRGSWSKQAVDLLERREDLVEEYAWAIPNKGAIATIAEQAPILEVGSGRGYWAKLVRDYLDDTAAVVATEANVYDWDAVWDIPLLEMDAVDAIEEYGDVVDALFLCWPPNDDPMAADALDAYGGDTVIYVGEGRGGCTADDQFHDQLHNEWELEDVVDIPSYLGIRDRLEVWARD